MIRKGFTLHQEAAQFLSQSRITRSKIQADPKVCPILEKAKNLSRQVLKCQKVVANHVTLRKPN